MVTLENDRFAVVVDPEKGGSIASFRSADGTPIFRDARLKADATASDAACFPMVPFCNRVRDNAFVAAGRRIRLRPNTNDGERVAHGFGWRSVWSVSSRWADCVVLKHGYTAADWPWSYVAEQDIRLGCAGLAITLSLTNTSPEPMPAGLGLHPYFPLHESTRVQFSAERCHALGEDGFSLRTKDEQETLLRASNGLLNPLIGNRYFDGVKGVAVLSQADGITLTLRNSAECRSIALHVERDNGLFCLEPMTHAVGAINLPPGDVSALPLLSRFETLSLRVECIVSRV